jgi:SSS family solute:Na+ symporter
MVVLLALIGALVSLHLCSIEWAWKYFSSVYAGVGFIYLLRWFWRRINAWSEISAMLASVVVSNFIYIWTDIEYPYTLLYTIGFSVPIAFLVTFLSAPVSDRTWKEYCRRVEPYKLGRGGVRRSLAVYVCSVLCLYALLVGIGKVLFGSTGIGATLIVIALCAGFFMMRLLRRSYAPS